MLVTEAFGTSGWQRVVLSVCLGGLAWAASAQGQDRAKPERFMSRSLKNISPEQGIKYTAQAQLGTASRIPNTNMILVVADPLELSRAKVMLELVDSGQEYLIRSPYKASEFTKTPFHEALSEQLKDISIGTFAAPPTGQAKAIVDVHNDSILIVAPAAQMDRILQAMDKLLEQPSVNEQTAQPAPAEPNAESQLPSAPNEPPSPQTKPAALQNDEFFNEVLESLAEAERIQAELKRSQAEPNRAGPPEQITRNFPPAETQRPAPQEPVAEPGPTTPMPHSKTVEVVQQTTEPAFKKRSYEPEPEALAKESLELDLPEVLNIVDLIDLVGKYLDLDLLYDPAEVKGQVTLRVQDKITVGELYPLLESVLNFRGFVMSRKGNLVTIRPTAKALEIDPVMLDTDKKLQYGDVIVTRVFHLRYIDTASAKNLLSKMNLAVDVEPLAEAKKLIVTGYAYRMNRIEELLTVVDQPGELKEFRYRQLRYTMAKSLTSQVETLAEQLGTVSVTVGAPAQPQPARPTRRGRTPARAPTPAPAPTPGAPTVYLDADERTNRILMIGLSEQLDIVEKLIDSLDVAQQDLRTLRLYDIQYVGAEEVRDKLIELGVISGPRQARPTGRITRPQQRGEQAQAEPAASLEVTEEGLVEEPLVVTIESTNSLLVNATAEQHATIATIIAYVDAEPEEAAINYVVYPLENQDPEQLAGVLNQLIRETIEERTDKDSKVIRTTRSKIEEDISIIPDASTYSLVVYASKKNQQWISALIKDLDEYRPQVLLEATLVEITQNEKFEYDLEMIAQTLGGASLRSSQVTQLEDFTTTRYADVRSATSATDAVIKAFLNSENVQALLTAIQTKGYGRIMARPKILVNDNQEGQIKTQNTISVAQVKSIVTIPETGSPVTTKDVSFNDYEAGVTLNIKPHISKGDMLRLEITLNRTDFSLKDPIEITDEGGTQTYPSPPDRLSTDVTTVGTVPNGTTIILGGLETITQSKGHSQVPILGDIPLIGGLFRGVTDTGDQSRLYVFVKANIIRPGDQVAGLEDIRSVSETNRQAFEQMEDKFQKFEDWPGIKPQPLDPVRVLGAD